MKIGKQLLRGLGGGLGLGLLGTLGAGRGGPGIMSLLGGMGGNQGGPQGGNPMQGMPQAQPQAMPGQMGQVASPMQPIQQQQAAPPTSFGQPTGMFGSGPDPRQAMMQKFRQWQMINGGGY